MAKRSIKINLDFLNKDILSKFTIKQFDNATITVTPLLGLEPLDPRNNTCKLYVSVGEEVYLQSEGIQTSENSIIINLDRNVVSSPGRALAELELLDSNGVFTSTTFIFEIEPKVGEGATLPGQVEGFIAKHERLISEFRAEVNPQIQSINSNLKTLDATVSQQRNKNDEQDTRLKEVEYKNKVQDVYVQGLFNENKDGRLSIEGEGNSLKLEGSKEGLVTIDKVVGNTFVNLLDVNDEITSNDNLEIKNGLWHINNVPNSSISNHVITFTGNDKNIVFRRLLNTMFLLKPSTTYTLIFDVISTDYTTGTVKIGNSDKFTNIDSIDVFQNVGIKKLLVTTLNDFTNAKYDFYIYFQHLLTGTIKFKMYILEGDYTDKPIPSEYFEGKQSTFEDSKVTQEMVDSGEESIENLGKYKCEVEIRGKNLLELQDVTQTLDLTGSLSPQSGVSNGSIIYKNVDVSSFKGQYILSGDFTLDSNKYNLKAICHNIENTKNTHNDSYNYLIQKNGGKEFNFNTPIDLTNYKYITITTGNIVPLESKIYTVKVNKLQIEEGTQVTSHEPYYYSTKTIYLNSPLHKTDEIVYIDGELKHYHKMGSYLLSHNDDIRMYDNNLSNCNRYGLAMTGYKFKSNGEGCCDKIPYIQNNSDDIFHVRLDGTKPYGGLTLWLPKQYGSTVDELKTYMRDNNIEYNLILELAEPYYETIDTDRLLLEIPNNATVSVKSVVPVQSMAASYTNGIPNVYVMESDITTLQDTSVDIIATGWDTDYRLSEVEWTLEDNGLLSPMLFNINTKNIKGGNTMALTKFEQAKIMILGGAYNRVTLTRQLDRYLEKRVITQSEYDELIALMEARELVTGE